VAFLAMSIDVDCVGNLGGGVDTHDDRL